MDYFCYISRTKVDHLYQNLSYEEFLDDKTGSEKPVNTGASRSGLSSSNVISLFKGDMTYGRKGVLQWERKAKVKYVEKLHRVLLKITKDSTIPSLSESISSGEFKSLYYHHKAPFQVTKAISTASSSTIITIITEVLSYNLFLDCSLRFFSEGNDPSGSYSINSSNHSFFSRNIALVFETVFMLLNRNESNKTITGTPLFLKLSADDPSSTMVRL